MSKSLGQVAFEAYREQVRVAWTGEPIPEWDQLTNGGPARAGWEAAALAVVHADAGMDPPTRAQRETRWQSLDAVLPPLVTDWRSDVVLPKLPPVDESTVQQARESVPVEAEQDDGADDERPVECDHPGCTIRHDDY